MTLSGIYPEGGGAGDSCFFVCVTLLGPDDATLDACLRHVQTVGARSARSQRCGCRKTCRSAPTRVCLNVNRSSWAYAARVRIRTDRMGPRKRQPHRQQRLLFFICATLLGLADATLVCAGQRRSRAQNTTESRSLDHNLLRISKCKHWLIILTRPLDA